MHLGKISTHMRYRKLWAFSKDRREDLPRKPVNSVSYIRYVATESLKHIILVHIPLCNYSRSRDSSVCIATGYRLGGWGSISYRRKRFLCTQRSDRIFGPPNLLSSVGREVCLWGKASGTSMKTYGGVKIYFQHSSPQY
jgi:hypothetical protein